MWSFPCSGVLFRQINVCKAKKLTNMRAAHRDIAEGIVPPIDVTLDYGLEIIGVSVRDITGPRRLRPLPTIWGKMPRHQASQRLTGYT